MFYLLWIICSASIVYALYLQHRLTKEWKFRKLFTACLRSKVKKTLRGTSEELARSCNAIEEMIKRPVSVTVFKDACRRRDAVRFNYYKLCNPAHEMGYLGPTDG